MRFASEEESRRSWLRNQAVIEGCRFWISRWTPDWRSDRDSPLALVWFHFPNLPIHLFDFEAISRICAPFGRAIALDSTTSRRSRPNMARVRLEINVLQPFVEKIWIEFENGNGKLDGFWQSIVRERVPFFCEYCNRFGHSTGRCWNARTESAEEGECRGMPHACENALLTEVAVNDAPTVGVGAESAAVKLGLEELAREGVSIEHFVDEAVLEAAVNIIEEAAGKVMDEGVECVIDGEDSQKDDTQGEDDPNLETEESSHSISYNTWFENLKEKIGSNKKLMTVVMEAKQEVESFFDNAIQELGRDGCEEKANELIQKANGIFLWKVAAKGMSIEKGMRDELRGVRVRAESEMQESGGSSKGEVKNKEKVFKNTMEWVKVVDAYMKEDRVLEQKVREALKEVNEYLWTVYDKEKEEYFEEGRNRAMKAAAIFLVKVRHCPSWGRENGLLGRHLKSNIDTIGARICHWAVTMNLQKMFACVVGKQSEVVRVRADRPPLLLATLRDEDDSRIVEFCPCRRRSCCPVSVSAPDDDEAAAQYPSPPQMTTKLLQCYLRPCRPQSCCPLEDSASLLRSSPPPLPTTKLLPGLRLRHCP
nr:TMV resistance protein N-like [Ipomoea batatas]